jgi:hypothetical protein
VNTYPRETVEFQAVSVAVDGAAVTTGVQLAVVPSGQRPDTWADPTSLDGKIGVMVDGLAVGYWHVWAKVTSTPEQPVIFCGSLQVT